MQVIRPLGLRLLGLLICAGSLHGQVMFCSFPFAGLQAKGPDIYVKATLMPSGQYVCERVYLDDTTQDRRDPATKALFRSAMPAAPPVVYTTLFQAEYKPSNQKEAVSTPPTNFDGQMVWCSTRNQQLANNQQVTDAQQARTLPIEIIEVREGIGSTVLTSVNAAWPDNAFHRWNIAHPLCGGLPGMTFAVGADMIYQIDQRTSPAPLLQMWVVSIVPSA